MADRPDAVIASPLPGNLRIGLRFGEKGLVSIDFLPADTPLRQSRDPAIQSVVEQLEMFFRDGKERFDVALDLRGTVFQQRVWRALIDIKPGERKSYGQVSKELGTGSRAVANACRANPIPIIVPCHRVVAVHGLGGYMGAVGGEALQIKKWLLHHEGSF